MGHDFIRRVGIRVFLSTGLTVCTAAGLGCQSPATTGEYSFAEFEAINLSAPTRSYAKGDFKFDATGKSASAELKPDDKKVVIKTEDGDEFSRSLPDDLSAKSIAFGKVTSDQINDLVVIGNWKEGTLPSKVQVLVYPGKGDGDFDDASDTITIEDLKVDAAPVALCNLVKRKSSDTTDQIDLVFAGLRKENLGFGPQLIIIPGHNGSFEDTSESDWLRYDVDIEIDDVLPGEIDAGMYGLTAPDVNESTTDDLLIRYNGSALWMLIIRTGDRSLEIVP